MSEHSFLQIRTAKDDETKPDAAQSLFSSIVPGSVPMWKRIVFGNPKTYSFEIYLLGQTVYFYAVTPKTRETYVKSLLQSSYPSRSERNLKGCAWTVNTIQKSHAESSEDIFPLFLVSDFLKLLTISEILVYWYNGHMKIIQSHATIRNRWQITIPSKIRKYLNTREGGKDQSVIVKLENPSKITVEFTNTSFDQSQWNHIQGKMKLFRDKEIALNSSEFIRNDRASH